MSEHPDEDLIDLVQAEVIDLSKEHEPSLVEVSCSAVVRKAAERSLHELESHRDHAPWVVVCADTSEVIAASPSFDPDASPDWHARLDDGVRSDRDGVPLVLVGLGTAGRLDSDDAAAGAAQLVVHALSEIVVAEHRAAIATARAGRAEALAATDALTGLGNQRAWWERIAEEDARIQRSESSAVVAVIDLDGLKTINDERGHLHGDLVLRLAARTLRRAMRSCDVVARVGGDEFAVLAVDFDGDPSVINDRIAKALEEAEIHASVGVAVPSPGTSIIDAYARADRAMYASKRSRHRQPSAGA
jgi:diguanylate cyclase (GGDEF)-like protein